MTPRANDPSALHALLDAGAVHHAWTVEGYVNHRPMALQALHELGATPPQLQAFAEAYAPRLLPGAPPERWPAGDAWAGRLGQREALPLYRGLFHEWLLHEGVDEVLGQVLPRLMAGCGGAAFHGLLRTAHGVRALHTPEVADGLALWAAAWLPLGARPGAETGAALDPLTGEILAPAAGRGIGDDADLASVLRRLQRAVPGPLPDAAMIPPRMTAAAAAPGFEAALQRLPFPRTASTADVDAALQALARTAAGLYARHGNFTVLHMVTSALAGRVLMGFLDTDAQRAAALRGLWRAWAAAFLASGVPAPRAGDAPAAAPADWRPLLAAARRSTDDHAIKLVAACREAGRHWGGDVWRAAAARALG